MIKVVLIDDEESPRNFIKKIITTNLDGFEVVAEGYDVASGIKAINEHKPDIVFLDIDMPDGNGFDLLQKLVDINFKLIFVTAHSEYAINAIKFSAIDYILKPIDIIDFTNAVKKAMDSLKKDEENIKIKAFLSFFEKNKPQKLVLKTSENIYVVDIQDISRCQSDNNYTTFFLKDKRKIVVSKTLKEYENLLIDYGFIRVHRSHLINLNYVERFNKRDSGYICMLDSTKIPVSHRKKEVLLQKLEELLYS